MITIDDNELQGLVNYLQEQPAKFSNPLLNFFDGKVQAERAKEAGPGAPTQEQINNMEVVTTDSEKPKPPKRPNPRVKKLESNG
jgi:hypothetical protein